MYLLIKHIKSILWRVVKRLSYIEDARCVKVNIRSIRYDTMHSSGNEHLCKHNNTIKNDLHSVTRRQLKKQFSRNLLLQVHVSLENGAKFRINIYVLPGATSDSDLALKSYTVIQQRENTAEPMSWPTAGTDKTGTTPCSPNPLAKLNISANENLECS